MYALYYADKFEFIATLDTTVQAAKVAKSLSIIFHRDVVAVFNSDEGRTTPWCTFRNGLPIRMNGEWPQLPAADRSPPTKVSKRPDNQ